MVDEDAAPATVGELRSLRRWLAVAGVWAVAASAIAVIALLKANENDQRGAVTGRQLSGVERDLDHRIDALESRVKDLPQATDLAKLDSRLKTVEDRVSSARDDTKAVRSDLDDLQKRVDSVEQQQKQSSSSGDDTKTSP